MLLLLGDRLRSKEDDMYFSETGWGLTPEDLLTVTEGRRSDLMEEAKIYRVLKKARLSNPRLPDRLLMSVGSFLISMGKRLQGRYASVIPHSSGTYRPGC